jgi:Arc/MetJ family transcription regulator
VSRTNIDIDDELIADVMGQYQLRTKREAVDFALRKVRREAMTKDEMLAMRGAGWDGDLDAIKGVFRPLDA